MTMMMIITIQKTQCCSGSSVAWDANNKLKKQNLHSSMWLRPFSMKLAPAESSQRGLVFSDLSFLRGSNNKSNNAKIHNPTLLHPFPMTLARAENSARSVVLIFQYCFGFQQQVKQAYNNTNNRVYKNRRQTQKTNTIKRLYAIHKDTPRAPH